MDALQKPSSRRTPGDLERGRESYDRRAWDDAFAALSLAERSKPLEADDLERLAISAALTGRDEEFLDLLERLHHLHLDNGNNLLAARTAFWLGLRLGHLGESARAGGWLARAARLVEEHGGACVEEGYLLLPVASRQNAAGEHEAAREAAARAAEIGRRYGDPDLTAIASNHHGRALLRLHRIEEGLKLLDEAMLAATAGELSPIVAGIVYCAAIDGCHHVYALSRAREWTSALGRWCDAQPQLVTFADTCRVHRAEILQLNGAWQDASEEAQRAANSRDRSAIGPALYQEAELHRLRGEFAAAEEKYRSASQSGHDPQPGLALLRVAQGRPDAAAGTIRRVLGGTTDSLSRARLLPAVVEIMLAADEVDEARDASLELEEIAASFDLEVLLAIANHARGAVHLAEGNALAALPLLRQALSVWQGVEAPYIAARIRVLVGLACSALSDEDGAKLEFDAAEAAFEELGAIPDLARLAELAGRGGKVRPHGLTPRELQVLKLVAAGRTNKAIAAELNLSGKTVDRHVSNIFVKLDVASRSAATAFAYEHKLV